MGECALRNQTCLVLGSGISGMAATQLLEYMGARVILFDESKSLTPEALQKKLPQGSSVRCVVGRLPETMWEEIQHVVLSPGVPLDVPFVVECRERGKHLLGEIELGYLAEKGQVAAITGTNGKTTTTTLVGEIMKAYKGEEACLVVGNIGRPYTGEVVRTGKDTVTVAEISSFQLETVDTFHPRVSAILNITPDHLNRHHTMEAYAAAKEAIAARQTGDDVCVLNYDNEYTREFGSRCPARVVYFSSGHELEDGLYLKEDMVYLARQGDKKPLLNIRRDMRLVGTCNVENVMAAIAIAQGMGVPMELILEVIRDFRAVEHRIEFVATKGGVDYYNDSKGTNPDAAIQGIRAMDKPCVLIGGGYDKNNEFDEWVECFPGKVKELVLIGQTRDKIAECARAHGFHRIHMADSFEECLKLCTSLAGEGDSVLLSPACASWGMFDNYEQRGDLFKEYVRGLGDESTLTGK